MKKIIISRTDSIGDVILTLPLAGALKQHFPGCKVIFLGRSYTRPVIESCEHVDEFLEFVDPASCHLHLASYQAGAILHVFPVKEICKSAKKAGIPLRIGTSHRWYNWLYCNKLLHFSRKNSDLHEAQLNMKMLEGLGIKKDWSLEEIPGLYGLRALTPTPFSPPPVAPTPFSPPPAGRGAGGGGFRLILHPKSKGSAREWGLENFSRLIDLLPEEKFRIFVTGTAEEGSLMKDFLGKHAGRITDLNGKLSLSEMISLVGDCDGLVAASTGPLHIAAALGKHAIGLYAPMKPIWPKRWAPVGVNAEYLCLEKRCDDCRHSFDCACIRNVRPEDVASRLIEAAAKLS